MLKTLVIHDVVLVERLELEFERGLGVLTGETGAGKSILLDSLGLALGARADTGLVRPGADGAMVTAEIAVEKDHPALSLLVSLGVELSEGEGVILRRTVKSDGGSRAFLGGVPVPAANLRDFGSLAVEIHGQNDDRGLLNPRGHRALLDRFAGIDRSPIEAAWAEQCRIEEELGDARSAAENAERERDWLTHACAEIVELSPQPGEESALSEQRSAMQAGAKAGDALTGLDELIGGPDGAVAQLRQAARRIERGAIDHALLADALASLDRALIEANEAEERIARAAGALVFDPEALERVEARLFEIRALARKHRVDPDALAELGEQLAGQLRAIEAGADRIAGLEQSLEAARATYWSEAESLTNARREAALELDRKVSAELAPLKLDSARFRTIVSEGPQGPGGSDRVEFEIATNPGAPFGPLTRIASGGEMSRFILALKVALSDSKSAGTMIFDEIDRGVGGAVASAIGERLSRLAADSQVLVVTHSPQVAARASHHYRIEKRMGTEGSRTHVTRLTADQRREEIARMLSGAEVTEEARAQAARLLEAA